jgi:diguanylate cyclase (GGDEF)-like protein
MNLFPVYVAHFVLMLCYSVIFWTISYSNRRLRGMRVIAIGYGLSVIGILLTVAPVPPSLAWIGLVAGNILFLTTVITIQYGLMRFADPEASKRVGPLLLFLGACGIAYFSVIHPNDAGRVGVVAAALALQTAYSTFVLLRHAKGRVALPARMLSVLFVIFCCTSLIRLWGAVHYRTAPSQLPNHAIAWIAMLGLMMLNASTPIGYFWLATAELESELDQLSRIDALTGTLNRRALEEAIGQEISLARRYARTLSILAIDIDHFKQLNDTYGHAAGDAVLVSMAETMRGLLRTADHLARYGGEEFIVLLSSTEEKGARELAERLRRGIESCVVEFRGQSLQVTASFGVVAVNGATEEPWDEMILRADAALYRAKEGGRNRVESALGVMAV